MPSRWLVLRAGYISRQEQGRALSRLTGTENAQERFSGEQHFPVVQTLLGVSGGAGKSGRREKIQLGSLLLLLRRHRPASQPLRQLHYYEVGLTVKRRLWMKWLCCRVFSF